MKTYDLTIHTYMDEREGALLEHVAPEYFMEVYKRVQENARHKHRYLQEQVLKYEKLVEYRAYKGLESDYPKKLEKAIEHLERFIHVNADYLI